MKNTVIISYDEVLFFKENFYFFKVFKENHITTILSIFVSLMSICIQLDSIAQNTDTTVYFKQVNPTFLT